MIGWASVNSKWSSCWPNFLFHRDLQEAIFIFLHMCPVLIIINLFLTPDIQSGLDCRETVALEEIRGICAIQTDMRNVSDANQLYRSSSREVRIRVPIFSVVYSSRKTLPTKKGVRKGTTGGPSQRTGIMHVWINNCIVGCQRR